MNKNGHQGKQKEEKTQKFSNMSNTIGVVESINTPQTPLKLSKGDKRIILKGKRGESTSKIAQATDPPKTSKDIGSLETEEVLDYSDDQALDPLDPDPNNPDCQDYVNLAVEGPDNDFMSDDGDDEPVHNECDGGKQRDRKSSQSG